MFEYEFRKTTLFSSFDEALGPIRHLPGTRYTVYFLRHFRCRDGVCEIKRKLRDVAVFHDGVWFKFVESEEKPYARWTPEEHRSFYRSMGLERKALSFETRREVRLSRNAKAYAFGRSDDVFGLCFELETRRSRRARTDLVPDVRSLRAYAPYYRLEPTRTTSHAFSPCRRRPVLPLRGSLPERRYLKALKVDGVHGFVYSHSDFLWETWEDNASGIVRGRSLGNGTVYSAERMPDGSVVLLDVARVLGSPVYRGDVRHVLLDFLPSIEPSLPAHYRVQRYRRWDQDFLPPIDDAYDGIIYHTFDDRIFKSKPVETLDLLYENGSFVTRDASYPHPSLRNGVVYECVREPDGRFRVLRERRDRFLSNTPEQLENLNHSTRARTKS